MSPEAWGFLGILTTALAGIFAELTRTRRKLDGTATAEELRQIGDRATIAASEAAELARPTASGFAEKVLGALAELKAGQDELAHRLDRHIDDHASSDLRHKHRGNQP